MRSILVDHARSHAYAKSDGEARKITIDETMIVSQERAAEVVALDGVLKQLANFDTLRLATFTVCDYHTAGAQQSRPVCSTSAVNETRKASGHSHSLRHVALQRVL